MRYRQTVSLNTLDEVTALFGWRGGYFFCNKEKPSEDLRRASVCISRRSDGPRNAQDDW